MTDRLHEPPLVGTGSIGTQPGTEMTEIQAGIADHTITTYEHGLDVKARSQWSYARARFFRHRLAMVGIVLLIVIFVAGAFAGQIAPYDPTLPSADITVSPTFAGHHFFGTDQIGRDYFSRTLYGIRATEQVSLLVAGIASLIGILIGACSGYFGGWIDNLLMRTTDLFLVVPALAVLLVAAKYLGHGSPVRLALLLGLLFWTNIARIVRGSFLSYTPNGPNGISVDPKQADYSSGYDDGWTMLSSKPADNPSIKGQMKQAWAQPVGWEPRPAR